MRDGSNPKSLLPSGAFRISEIPSREIVFPSFWPKSSLGKTEAFSGFEKMYENAGLDSSSIANKVEETLNSNIILAKNRNKISN